MDSPYIFCGPEEDFAIPDITIGKLFYETLRTKPPSDVIVVDYSSGEYITRERLLNDSIKLSVALKNIGIKKGDIIAIISKNSWKFLVSVISAFYMGVTVCNINHNSFKDELLHCLLISKPKLMFISENAVSKIETLRRDLPFLEYVIPFDHMPGRGDILFDDLLNNDLDCTSFEVQKDDVEETLILYSSGTTGLPKGVTITQSNLKAGLKFIAGPNTIRLQDESMIGLLPMGHMFGLYMALTCLLYGRKNVIMEKFKPEVFLQCIQEHKITYLFIVPTLALFLVKSPLVYNYDLSSVKDILCGAAPLGKEVQDGLSKRLNVTVRQVYGTTETCGVTCTPPAIQRSGTVGKVIPDCQVKIVDTINGQTLGKNAVGEICYKGPALMNGYRNNKEANKECIDEEGFLHLGDIGYFDDEEYLYIVGRIKELIKYKGFQVPPVQLESILSQHPAIKDVAVIGKPDERTGELPTALVVRQTNSEITEEEIVSYLAERMPREKQLHGGVKFVEEIPRTHSGKILRQELKKFL